MEHISRPIEKVMKLKSLWIRNAHIFDDKSLWILAEKAKFPYNQWAAEELIFREKGMTRSKN